MRFSSTLIIMEKKPLLSRRKKKSGLNISGQKILMTLRKKSLKQQQMRLEKEVIKLLGEVDIRDECWSAGNNAGSQ